MNLDDEEVKESRNLTMDLLQQAHEYAVEYIESLPQRPVVPRAADLAGLSFFDEPLPDLPCAGSEILKALHEHGSRATLAQTGGRYFGFVNGAVLPTALAARWLADTWDQNAALHVMSPVASQLEQICERWLTDLLGLPIDTALGLVSGSSASIFCGLAAGRNELLRRQGWDANAKGLFGAPTIRVVAGEQAHAAVFKALAYLGLGKDQVELVASDDQGRMIADQMPVLDARTLLIVQAGNVSTGAFDPLEEICATARACNSWVHVDGAFGLWAAASNSKRELFRGGELADSWSADAHKTLNAPYDCGIILCRHRDALTSAMQAGQTSASYIQWSERRDGMIYTPDMSRRARAVDLWAALKSLGRTGIQELVDGLCERARQFGRELEKRGFDVRNDIVFNQVLISCGDAELTESTLSYIQESGECWCGGVTWNGEPAIRISVCSWKTTPDDIDRSVLAFVKAREKAIEKRV